MAKEFAGKDLSEIREYLLEEGFSEIHEDKGETGFTLWKPFGDAPKFDCRHVVVWPRKEGGGFWMEEY